MLLGRINGHAHNVRGELYALDEKTLVLTNFHYDGTAPGTLQYKLHLCLLLVTSTDILTNQVYYLFFLRCSFLGS